MEKNIKEVYIYIYIYIKLSHFAVQQKLNTTLYIKYTSIKTLFELKKKKKRKKSTAG